MILRPLILIFAISFFTFSTTSCSNKDKKEAQLKEKSAAGAKAPLRGDAVIVHTKEVMDNLEIPGTLVANESTEIHPEVSGRITGIYFKEGSFVKKGAMLVKLYDADLQAQKRKLMVQIKVAQQNQERTQQLVKIGGISKQDYENTELTSSNARADLDVINTNIQRTEVRAPFSGKLGLRMVSLGAYITQQATITTISDLNHMRIDFTVPEKYTRMISNGQNINFTVQNSNRIYAAKVIATESSISQNTRTLQVRAAVQGVQEGLVPGSFGKVALSFQPDANSIVIPTQAIIPEARGKKVYLYKNGIAKYVDITTGLRDSANVQVTSGLSEGDTVMITGLLSLKPDAKVQIRKVLNGQNKTNTKDAQAHGM